MINVRVSGKKRKFKKGITIFDISKKIKPKAIVAKLNGKLVDLSTKINKDSRIELLDVKSTEGNEVFRHSAAHVMAHAVTNLFPKAKLAIGPTVTGGFYYDMDHKPFKPQDLKSIEKEMEKVVKADYKIERIELTKAKALKLFKNNRYKLELIKEYGKELSVYKQGNFIDLCRGPHVPSTGHIKAFKLTKLAGAYWRADITDKQLQRVYGVAFPEKKELKQYLKVLEEAERRDHRKLGKQLELFSIHEEGPGFPFWLPKGMELKKQLLEFWRQKHKEGGYVEISTPIILSKELWVRSGHWKNYREAMYTLKIDKRDFAIKPMNCPGGMLVYKEKIHSYKELPLRVAELGLVHRHELSGVLAGLFRVRAFIQDDAHIYMTPEQLEDEIINTVKFCIDLYEPFGFEYRIELSTKPKKHIGTAKQWELLTNALKKSLEKLKIDYKVNEGEGAFYGPKIDFHLKDAIGREWQCGTIQVDMAQPENFDLTYEGKDGRKHRPIMIHRALYGSIERFIAILIEHYAGKFPLWLAPVQIRILTVADRFKKYANETNKTFTKNNFRSEVDDRTESISYKVRQAQLEKIPLILTVGEKEKKKKTVAVRTLDGKVYFNIKIDDFIRKVDKAIKQKVQKIRF